MRVICVIRGGLLESVYADSADVTVDLLDYDNMVECDLDSEDGRAEYESYKELEKEIFRDGTLPRVW